MFASQWTLLVVAEENTCYIEVGGNFAVGQCKPDESQTHTEGSRHISQIVTFTWNTNALTAECAKSFLAPVFCCKVETLNQSNGAS